MGAKEDLLQAIAELEEEKSYTLVKKFLTKESIQRKLSMYYAKE